MEFVQAIAHQYVRFDRKTERLNVSILNLVSKSTNGHYLAKPSQGVVSFVERTILWFVVLVTFNYIWNISLYIILIELNL